MRDIRALLQSFAEVGRGPLIVEIAERRFGAVDAMRRARELADEKGVSGAEALALVLAPHFEREPGPRDHHRRHGRMSEAELARAGRAVEAADWAEGKARAARAAELVGIEPHQAFGDLMDLRDELGQGRGPEDVLSRGPWPSVERYVEIVRAMRAGEAGNGKPFQWVAAERMRQRRERREAMAEVVATVKTETTNSPQEEWFQDDI